MAFPLQRPRRLRQSERLAAHGAGDAALRRLVHLSAVRRRRAKRGAQARREHARHVPALRRRGREGSAGASPTAACPPCCCSPRRDTRTRRPAPRSIPNGLVPQAIRAIKKACPKLLVWADVCLCGATDHGHCGHVTPGGVIDNDTSVETLAQVVARLCARRRRCRRAERHDGRPRARHPPAARPERFCEHADRFICGEIRLRRSMARSAKPRSRRRPSATAAPTRWIRRTAAKRCARCCWMSKRARTW